MTLGLPVLGEAGAVLHLLIIVCLMILYVKFREIVILPSIMFASIIGVLLGFEAHPFILGISGFAAALIVFIAGLELNHDFLVKNKEKALTIFFFESVLLISLFYALSFFFGLSVAIPIAAIMVASNETFIMEVKNRSSDGRIDELIQYGITLSVLEDALAVMLLSIGFFTNPSFQGKIPQLELLLVYSIILVPLLYVASKYFCRLIDYVKRLDAKILVSILYLALLISIGDFLGLPEAIPVFIGAITLSLHKFDKKTFNAIESYFILALVGFVASLPYLVKENTTITLTPMLFLNSMFTGVGLALAAFVLRSFILFFACILGGLKPDQALTLALPLANTGEFGLIVLAGLVSRRIIPATIAFAALFAYAFNLTFVSEITKNLNKLKVLISGYTPLIIKRFIIRVSNGSDEMVKHLSLDVNLKESIVRMSVLVVVVYSISGLYWLVAKYPYSHYFLTIFLFAAFITCIQELSERFIRAFSGVKGSMRIVRLILTLTVFYIVTAPMLHYLNDFLTSGKSIGLPLPLDSPYSLLLLIIIVLLLRRLCDKIAKSLIKS